MLKKNFLLLISSFILIHSAIVCSQSSNPPTVESELKSKIHKVLPQLEIEAIKPSPVPNIYEVMTGSNILYVTKDGRYAFTGDIIDFEGNNQNITESSRKIARVSALNKLGENNMIVFGPENSKYTVTVFTDIDCGYCRKLHQDINKLNSMGIKIRYLAFPRQGPGSDSFEKTTYVWCAKDKQAALTKAKNGEQVISAKCDTHKVAEQFQLGVQIGINGTPTMILEDGTVIPGYLPPEKLLEVLKSPK